MNEMMQKWPVGFESTGPAHQAHSQGPEGVRGRNSDNELILEKLGWAPTGVPEGWAADDVLQDQGAD